MDIENELKEIIYNHKTNDDVVIELENEIANLMKKSYLFKVIAAAEKIENIISDDFIKNNEIKSLIVQCPYSAYYSIHLSLPNKRNTRMAQAKKDNIVKLIKMLGEHINDLTYIDPSWTNLNQYTHENTIDLKPGIGKQIFNLLLSKELISLYEYTKMQIELPNNGNKKKEIKI
jgi:hypothetical protein